MPRTKPCKRAREEDPESNQPIAKRLTQMNLNEVELHRPEYALEQMNGGASAVQLMTHGGPPSNDVSEQESYSQDLDWPPLEGFNPDMNDWTPLEYDPEIPATGNPNYYEVNRILFEAHVLWIERQRSRGISA